MTRRTIRRGIIFDGIMAVFVAALIVINACSAVVRLITQPDRDLLRVGLDWLTIGVIIAAVALTVIMTRRVLAKFDREEAARERRAQIDYVKRASSGKA